MTSNFNIISDEEDENAAQYREPCDQCGRILHKNVHIFIMTHAETNAEQTVCSGCRDEIDWEPGWRDDTEEIDSSSGGEASGGSGGAEND